MTRTGPLQGLAEDLKLLLPPYKWGEDTSRSRLQTRPRGLSADELVDVYRTREPRDPDWV